jgi:hypothetical protein
VELEKIRAFRQKAQADSEHLFNELAAMAQDHQRQNS